MASLARVMAASAAPASPGAPGRAEGWSGFSAPALAAFPGLGTGEPDEQARIPLLEHAEAGQ
ncbi:MAG: hypothetical protein WHV64_03295 [Geminicoccaceae bacterium]